MWVLADGATIADAGGQWQTLADNGRRRRALTDADGHWETRTLADTDTGQIRT